MEMPSDTVMVLNNTLLAPASSAPLAAASASLSICMLHGVTIDQVEAMPTCALAKSSRLKPTGYSMARLGACSTPSTTTEECGRLVWVMDDPLGSRIRTFCLMARWFRTRCRWKPQGTSGREADTDAAAASSRASHPAKLAQRRRTSARPMFRMAVAPMATLW